jgi:hypothetical protein
LHNEHCSKGAVNRGTAFILSKNTGVFLYETGISYSSSMFNITGLLAEYAFILDKLTIAELLHRKKISGSWVSNS